MDKQLSPADVQHAQQLLQESEALETAEMQGAIATLEKHNGDVELSFQELWEEEVGSLGSDEEERNKLWTVTLKVLRQEVCGDDGFRAKITDYNKNPESASLLAGAVVYLVGLTTLPINPAIATIVVLYLLKVGLNIFCEYTEPTDADKAV
ncbi:MAG: hypothetical protein AAGD25_17385 [Cyanobacteria bacterium P01_F01_bin.150]